MLLLLLWDPNALSETKQNTALRYFSRSLVLIQKGERPWVGEAGRQTDVTTRKDNALGLLPEDSTTNELFLNKTVLLSF